ncbi:sugar transferase [Roseovarius sp. MMSF_3359]|uniref:sugar transferase n=1 Tax=Roseovarius sp. MMSF_3359 TaxID=3046707 RepID=UPI00273DC0E4|nr:sugar transferase [Roseovarius sp. MMSF_3359]
MSIQDNDFETRFAFAEKVAPLTDFSNLQKGAYRHVFKRLFDCALVLISAPIVVPVVLFLALLVARDGHNPFYKQSRIGKNGRVFTMWKLRTMVHDAEARLENHLKTNKSARAEWQEKQKLAEDPRITSTGQMLRKTSLDELPQLWNVLIGDMSIVGPRPMMPEQRDLYPGRAYYALRPRVTGYWQISDRNKSTFAARAKFDNRYYEDVSLSTDASIVLSTVGVVLRGTGC